MSRPGLIALLLAAAAACWALTGDRMAGMDAGPGTDLGGFGWFVVVWMTMMAAMMLPSVAPVAVAHGAIQADRGSAGRGGLRRSTGFATGLFVAGYLIAWGAAGVLAYAIVETVRSLDLGFLAWEQGGRYVAGGVILAAAVYQLAALKRRYLSQCRSPPHRHPGLTGALRMGIEHGGSCIGCCWALMAALFALGVMNVGWMALIAALIATEKLLRWRGVATAGIATVLVVIGIAVSLSPEDVPGLTIPGAHDAGGAMGAVP